MHWRSPGQRHLTPPSFSRSLSASLQRDNAHGPDRTVDATTAAAASPMKRRGAGPQSRECRGSSGKGAPLGASAAPAPSVPLGPAGTLRRVESGLEMRLPQPLLSQIRARLSHAHRLLRLALLVGTACVACLALRGGAEAARATSDACSRFLRSGLGTWRSGPAADRDPPFCVPSPFDPPDVAGLAPPALAPRPRPAPSPPPQVAAPVLLATLGTATHAAVLPLRVPPVAIPLCPGPRHATDNGVAAAAAAPIGTPDGATGGSCGPSRARPAADRISHPLALEHATVRPAAIAAMMDAEVEAYVRATFRQRDLRRLDQITSLSAAARAAIATAMTAASTQVVEAASMTKAYVVAPEVTAGYTVGLPAVPGRGVPVAAAFDRGFGAGVTHCIVTGHAPTEAAFAAMRLTPPPVPGGGEHAFLFGIDRLGADGGVVSNASAVTFSVVVEGFDTLTVYLYSCDGACPSHTNGTTAGTRVTSEATAAGTRFTVTLDHTSAVAGVASYGPPPPEWSTGNVTIGVVIDAAKASVVPFLNETHRAVLEAEYDIAVTLVWFVIASRHDAFCASQLIAGGTQTACADVPPVDAPLGIDFVVVVAAEPIVVAVNDWMADRRAPGGRPQALVTGAPGAEELRYWSPQDFFVTINSMNELYSAIEVPPPPPPAIPTPPLSVSTL